RHNTPNYVAALVALASPFAVAAFTYDSAPSVLGANVFDWICAFEVSVVNLVAAWFLLWRFLWRRELTVFHAAVPRILAGIIVGYLPIFFIDEVWSLAAQSWRTLFVIVALLGATTMLYLYIEVQRRLGESREAFARARQIFLLGLLQAAGIGILLTGMIGHFMAARSWSGGGEQASIEVMRAAAAPFIGQLPLVLGIAPYYVFPSAVFMMSFMSFFIGTFLQLMWEDIPITEPL
ncbi:MAG: hypothetical protein ACREI7_07565, partial [Myxococcota bacterium]